MGVTLDDFAPPAEAVAPPPPPGSFATARAVAFDLDNTLLDIIRIKRAAAEAAAWTLADAGMDLDPEEGAEAIFQTALELGIDRDDIVEAFLRRRVGAPTPHLLEVGRHAYERAEDQAALPYPRVHSTLLELSRRGFPLFLITDAPRHKALRRLQAARLLPFFKDVIAREDSPRGKEDQAPYLLAASRHRIPLSHLVMVGDNPARDIGMARSLGCRTVLARYGLQECFASGDPRHQADHEIQWFDELLSALPGGQPR